MEIVQNNSDKMSSHDTRAGGEVEVSPRLISLLSELEGRLSDRQGTSLHLRLGKHEFHFKSVRTGTWSKGAETAELLGRQSLVELTFTVPHAGSLQFLGLKVQIDRRRGNLCGASLREGKLVSFVSYSNIYRDGNGQPKRLEFGEITQPDETAGSQKRTQRQYSLQGTDLTFMEAMNELYANTGATYAIEINGTRYAFGITKSAASDNSIIQLLLQNEDDYILYGQVRSGNVRVLGLSYSVARSLDGRQVGLRYQKGAVTEILTLSDHLKDEHGFPLIETRASGSRFKDISTSLQLETVLQMHQQEMSERSSRQRKSAVVTVNEKEYIVYPPTDGPGRIDLLIAALLRDQDDIWIRCALTGQGGMNVFNMVWQGHIERGERLAAVRFNRGTAVEYKIFSDQSYHADGTPKIELHTVLDGKGRQQHRSSELSIEEIVAGQNVVLAAEKGETHHFYVGGKWLAIKYSGQSSNTSSGELFKKILHGQKSWVACIPLRAQTENRTYGCKFQNSSLLEGYAKLHMQQSILTRVEVIDSNSENNFEESRVLLGFDISNQSEPYSDLSTAKLLDRYLARGSTGDKCAKLETEEGTYYVPFGSFPSSSRSLASLIAIRVAALPEVRLEFEAHNQKEFSIVGLKGKMPEMEQAGKVEAIFNYGELIDLRVQGTLAANSNTFLTSFTAELFSKDLVDRYRVRAKIGSPEYQSPAEVVGLYTDLIQQTKSTDLGQQLLFELLEQAEGQIHGPDIHFLKGRIYQKLVWIELLRQGEQVLPEALFEKPFLAFPDFFWVNGGRIADAKFGGAALNIAETVGRYQRLIDYHGISRFDIYHFTGRYSAHNTTFIPVNETVSDLSYPNHFNIFAACLRSKEPLEGLLSLDQSINYEISRMTGVWEVSELLECRGRELLQNVRNEKSMMESAHAGIEFEGYCYNPASDRFESKLSYLPPDVGARIEKFFSSRTKIGIYSVPTRSVYRLARAMSSAFSTQTRLLSEDDLLEQLRAEIMRRPTKVLQLLG